VAQAHSLTFLLEKPFPINKTSSVTFDKRGSNQGRKIVFNFAISHTYKKRYKNEPTGAQG